MTMPLFETKNRIPEGQLFPTSEPVDGVNMFTGRPLLFDQYDREQRRAEEERLAKLNLNDTTWSEFNAHPKYVKTTSADEKRKMRVDWMKSAFQRLGVEDVGHNIDGVMERFEAKGMDRKELETAWKEASKKPDGALKKTLKDIGLSMKAGASDAVNMFQSVPVAIADVNNKFWQDVTGLPNLKSPYAEQKRQEMWERQERANKALEENGVQTAFVEPLMKGDFKGAMRGLLNSTARSLVQQTGNFAVNAAFGGAASTLAMAASSAEQKYNELKHEKNSGLTDGQMRNIALLEGVWEGLFEHYGSEQIFKKLKTGDGNLMKAWEKNPELRHMLASATKEILGIAAKEGSEEFNTEGAQWLTDKLFRAKSMDEFTDIAKDIVLHRKGELFKQMGEAGVIGATTGLGMSGVSIARQISMMKEDAASSRAMFNELMGNRAEDRMPSKYASQAQRRKALDNFLSNGEPITFGEPTADDRLAALREAASIAYNKDHDSKKAKRLRAKLDAFVQTDEGKAALERHIARMTVLRGQPSGTNPVLGPFPTQMTGPSIPFPNEPIVQNATPVPTEEGQENPAETVAFEPVMQQEGQESGENLKQQEGQESAMPEGQGDVEQKDAGRRGEALLQQAAEREKAKKQAEVEAARRKEVSHNTFVRAVDDVRRKNPGFNVKAYSSAEEMAKDRRMMNRIRTSLGPLAKGKSDVELASMIEAVNMGDGTVAVNEDVLMRGANGDYNYVFNKLNNHEIGVHSGLSMALGQDKFNKTMLQLYNERAGDIKATMERYGCRFDTDSDAGRVAATEEFLARMSEKGVQKPSWWKQFIAQIRSMLRSLGFNMELTDSDIETLLARGQKAAQKMTFPTRKAASGEAKPSISNLWTGSAASYDKPSLNYIGTGEGNQAFGWGLYASDQRGIAKGYANRLSKKWELNYKGMTFRGPGSILKYEGKLSDLEKNALLEVIYYEDPKNAIKELNNAIKEYEKEDKDFYLERIKELKKIKKHINDNFNEYKIGKGRNLYRQTWFLNRVTDGEANLLDWNGKVTDEQKEQILDALSQDTSNKDVVSFVNREREDWQTDENGNLEEEPEYYPQDVLRDYLDTYLDFYDADGKYVYNQLKNLVFGSPKKASEFLFRAGIDGIRYPAGSHGSGDGSKGWNYVSFSDTNMRVDEHIAFSLARKEAEKHSRQALQDIADGKEYGVLHNEKYGEIRYPLGSMGKHGHGLLHIVENRIVQDHNTLDEAINIAIKVGMAAEIGEETLERYNTHHLDYDGVRAIIAVMSDNTAIITGYEINADDDSAANRRAEGLQSQPHVSSAEIVAALKDKLARESDKSNNPAEKKRYSIARPDKRKTLQGNHGGNERGGASSKGMGTKEGAGEQGEIIPKASIFPTKPTPKLSINPTATPLTHETPQTYQAKLDGLIRNYTMTPPPAGREISPLTDIDAPGLVAIARMFGADVEAKDALPHGTSGVFRYGRDISVKVIRELAKEQPLTGAVRVKTADYPAYEQQQRQYWSQRLMAPGGEIRFQTAKDGNYTVAKAFWTDPTQSRLRSVLAHEVGHLFDWTAEGTTKSHGILGTLAGVHKFGRLFMQSYSGMLFSDERIRKELTELTRWWSGDWSKASSAYRTSNAELFAEAFSVLFCAPSEFRARCPEAWALLQEFQQSRPDAVKAWRDMMHAMTDNTLEAKIIDQLLAEDRAKAEANAKQTVTDPNDVMYNGIEKWIAGFVRRVQNKFTDVENLAKEKGLNYGGSPLPAILEMTHMSSVQQYMKEISKAIDEAGIPEPYMDEMMKYHRIAYDTGLEGKVKSGTLTADGAKKMIDMKAKENPEYYKKFQDFHKKLWDIRQKAIVALANRTDAYSADLLNKLKTNEWYATKLLSDFVGPEGSHEGTPSAYIHGLKGSIEFGADALYATINGDVSLMTALLRNDALMKTIDLVKSKGWAVPARSIGPGVYAKPDSGWVQLTVLRDGKLERWNVVKNIGDAFTFSSLDPVTKAFSKMMGAFRWAWTRVRPSFWATNAMRDAKSSYYNLPADIQSKFDLATWTEYYIKGVHEAVKYMFTEGGSDVVAEMMWNNYFMPSHSWGDYDTSINQLENIRKKYGVGKDAKKKGVIGKGFDIAADISNMIEMQPKIAGELLLRDKTNLTDAERRKMVVEQIGSPDFAKGGLWSRQLNAYFTFFNANVQGMAQTLAAIADHPATYGKRVVQTIGTQVFLQTLLSIGASVIPEPEDKDSVEHWLWDKLRWTQRMYRKLSKWQYDNYFVVPVKELPDGRCVFFRMPYADTVKPVQKAIKDTIAHTYGSAYSSDQSLPFELSADFISYFPELNPVFSGYNHINMLLSGENPKDIKTGAPLVDTKMFNAGGLSRLTGSLIGLWNEDLPVPVRLPTKMDAENWQQTVETLGLEIVGLGSTVKIQDSEKYNIKADKKKNNKVMAFPMKK